MSELMVYLGKRQNWKISYHHRERIIARLSWGSDVIFIIAPATSCQFRPPIAFSTDLSGITTELWEILVFSPADGALILHTIT